MRTPALHLIAWGIFVDLSPRAYHSARICMKWESDDELRGARDGVVSENALLGAGRT